MFRAGWLSHSFALEMSRCNQTHKRDNPPNDGQKKTKLVDHMKQIPLDIYDAKKELVKLPIGETINLKTIYRFKKADSSSSIIHQTLLISVI